MSDSLRVVIAGGGSGGHVIPALAVARVLREQYSASLRFIGTARGMETRLVPAAGYPLDLVQVGQLNQAGLRRQIATLARLPVGILQCVGILREFRPHAVFSVGGYASGPAMAAAILTRTPLITYEPNAIPGLANRWAGHRVTAAAINFPESARYFRNAQLTGVPVRPEFFALPELSTDAPPKLLVFGGSQGSRALNRSMPQIAGTLLDAIPGLTILHQAGAGNFEETQRAYAESVGGDAALAGRWQVAPFLDDMPAAFAAASVILCRSGATTVAELAAAGKPSVLIPFPRAADDHQTKNAEAFVRAGAAILLREAELNSETLSKALAGLLADRARLQEMAQRARTMAHPLAAATIAAMIQKEQPGR